MCEYRKLCTAADRVVVRYTGPEAYDISACDECASRIPTRDAYGKPRGVHISDHAYYVTWLADKAKALEWKAREEKTRRMYEPMLAEDQATREAHAHWVESQYVDPNEREDV